MVLCRGASIGCKIPFNALLRGSFVTVTNKLVNVWKFTSFAILLSYSSWEENIQVTFMYVGRVFCFDNYTFGLQT